MSGAAQVAIMPCKTMANDLDVPFSAAIQCIEWCKTNFENIASMGGRQKTGIYTTAWGSNSASDGSMLSAVIRKVGEGTYILKSIHLAKELPMQRGGCTGTNQRLRTIQP